LAVGLACAAPWPTADAAGADAVWIAFASTETGNSDIYIVPAAGGEAANLTRHPARDAEPAWAPDGSAIAFVSDREGMRDLFLMGPNGANPRRIYRAAGPVFRPAWSPDGTRMAIEVADAVTGAADIWSVRADGADPVRLTDTPSFDGYPTWSPDGSRIAFASDRDGDAEVYVMSRDGSAPVRLTRQPLADYQPAWSPDGSTVAFVSERGGAPGVYVMRADGTGVSRASPASVVDYQPAWSADSSRIAFTSERDGNPEIYTMKPDGRDVVRLTRRARVDWQPSWSPTRVRVALLSATPARARSGALVTLTGSGLEPNGTAWITFESIGLLWAEVQTDAAGRFSARVRVPNVAPGPYDILARDASGTTAGALLVVEPAGAGAAFRFEYALPEGLSIFSPALAPHLLRVGDKTLAIASDGGVLMARHLIWLGATVVISADGGRLRAVVGENGALLFGRDHPIEPGKGYIVNLLTPTDAVMEGAPHGEAVPAAPSAPVGGGRGAWAFAVVGNVSPAPASSRAWRIRVSGLYGVSAEEPVAPDGEFAVAFVDASRRPVVAEGDILRVELLGANGAVLAGPTAVRVRNEDIRRAFVAVGLLPGGAATSLLPNFPNPGRGATWLAFRLEEESAPRIELFAPTGDLVRVFDLSRRGAGDHAVLWDGRNMLGERVARGVYTCVLRVAGRVRMRRLVMME
jgi:Tol biopolymer transport system component